MRRRVLALLAGGAVASGWFLTAGQAHAQDYPIRPIRLIVPWEIGRAHV